MNLKKFNCAMFALCAILFVVLTLGLSNQNEQIRKGNLVIIWNKTGGALSGGPIFIDKMARTVTSKASVFPITLREDENGNVLRRHDLIAYRAYVVAEVPASNEEVALYREYFPKA